MLFLTRTYTHTLTNNHPVNVYNSPFPLPTPFPKSIPLPFISPPQWGIAEAEIKETSVENPELKGFPFKAWSGSVCSRAG